MKYVKVSFAVVFQEISASTFASYIFLHRCHSSYLVIICYFYAHSLCSIIIHFHLLDELKRAEDNFKAVHDRATKGQNASKRKFLFGALVGLVSPTAKIKPILSSPVVDFDVLLSHSSYIRE
jgi:hypothetical protein